MFKYRTIKTALFVTIISLSCIVQSYGSSEQDVTLPFDFKVLDNGKEDYFYTSLQLINRKSVELFSDWNELQYEKKSEYEGTITTMTNELISIYNNPSTSNSDIGKITLEYMDYVDEFESNFIKPVVISDSETVYSIPKLSNQYFTYMPTRAITSTSSKQYKFKPFQESDSRGYVMYGDIYCIALGTYYGSDIGTVYEIEFGDGTIINGVLADVKSDLHTDVTNRYAESSMVFDGSKGNVLEFVMNDELDIYKDLEYSEKVRAIGSQLHKDFKEDVVKIKKVGVVDVMF